MYYHVSDFDSSPVNSFKRECISFKGEDHHLFFPVTPRSICKWLCELFGSGLRRVLNSVMICFALFVQID